MISEDEQARIVPYGKILSMLRNARNILAHGGFFYGDKIDEELLKIGIKPSQKYKRREEPPT
jgi:phosphoribosylformylglycinamidine (FGAM) synthase-like amidotransferase family enzyme